MTLIEIMFAYRNEVRHHGRESAHDNILCVVEPELQEHIIASVSDHGEFIDATGSIFHGELV